MVNSGSRSGRTLPHISCIPSILPVIDTQHTDIGRPGLEGIVIPDIGDGVLPEDGDIIVQFKDSPYIVTQFGM